MKKMKLVVLAVVIAMLFSMMAACSAPAAEPSEAASQSAEASVAPSDGAAADASAEPAAKDAYNFVFLSPNQGNPFWVSVSEGVKQTAEAKGATVTVYDAQDDPAKQVSQAEDAILAGVDALFVSPYETDTGTAITEKANEANIPVFILDTGAEGDYTAFITSDNKQGGKVAAEYLLENTGDDRNIAELQGLIGRVIPAQRGVGFNEVMDEKGVKVNYVQPADFNRSKGMDLMDTFLTQDPAINAVFCWNDEMALGAKEAIAAHGLTDKVLLIGFDATDEGLQAVKDGEMAATVAQNPFGFGEMGVELAYKHFNGESFEKDVLIECELITKDNVDEYMASHK